MTDIALRYKLTFEDYLSAQRLHAKRSLWPRFTFFVVWWAYPAIGLSLIAISFLVWRDHPHSANTAATVGGLLGGGAVLAPWRLFIRRNFKKNYWRTRCGEGEVDVLFNENGIFSEISGLTKGEFSWQATKSWREDKDQVLIYLAPAIFVIVPKRVVSEPQLQDLRALLEGKIMRPA
jgi:YcxB-like protein